MSQVTGEAELESEAARRPQGSNGEFWAQVHRRTEVLSAARALSGDQKPMGSGGRAGGAGLAELSVSPEEGRCPELAGR